MIDGELIDFLVKQIRKYRYCVNFDAILEQSKINTINFYGSFDKYYDITDKYDIINLSHIFIKITSYLYTINKIDNYKEFIDENKNIIEDNIYAFNRIDNEDEKSITILIVFLSIFNILERNTIYNNYYTKNLYNISEIIIY